MIFYREMPAFLFSKKNSKKCVFLGKTSFLPKEMAFNHEPINSFETKKSIPFSKGKNVVDRLT